MKEFINALKNLEINEIIPTLNKINNHIEKRYLTEDDKFFLDFCYPLIQCSCEHQKILFKENKNEIWTQDKILYKMK